MDNGGAFTGRMLAEAGVALGIGHERRYELAIGEVRRLVREGALGTIMHAEANFSHDKLANMPPGDWRLSAKDAPAAGMTAMGIHLTDLFLDLLGPATEAYAATTSRVAYPETGDVIIFDPRNYHVVRPNSGDGRRVSLSFFLGVTGCGELVYWS